MEKISDLLKEKLENILPAHDMEIINKYVSEGKITPEELEILIKQSQAIASYGKGKRCSEV